MNDHTASGRYYAICRPVRPTDVPYIRVFDFEQQRHSNGKDMTAEWFFLNQRDSVACLELLLPEDSFKIRMSLWDKFTRKFAPATMGLVRKRAW